MAGPKATGTAGTPGAVLLTATSISKPFVDNRQFSYWAECALNSPDVGVIGASVTYTISAANG
jgi:hypothetical protein